MANGLLTTSKITREAVMLFVNSNMFLRNVDRQYDSDFGKKGEKIGSQLRIRLPNDYTVTKGPAASVQDTTEQQTVLTLATQAHVDVSFATVDLLLSLDDFSERILQPAMNNLAGQVAVDVMSVVEQGYISLPSQAPSAPLTAITTGGICNLAYNTDSNGTLISPNSSTVLDAGAILSNNSARLDKRKVVESPRTEARLVNSLSGLFNPTPAISRQYQTGQMKNALGFDFFMDQTVVNHTNGTFTAGTVSAGGQTGYSVTTNAITGTLNVGDIITIDGVYAVNRVTKQTTGELRQFVVTASAANGATSISIYPAIIPSSGGNAVQYQTVTDSPIASAAVRMLIAPSTTYRKNVAYVPEAMTMVTGDLPLPKNVDAARAQYDGVSMRMVTQYQVGTDQEISRVDVLYGALAVRPEWGCIVADVI